MLTPRVADVSRDKSFSRPSSQSQQVPGARWSVSPCPPAPPTGAVPPCWRALADRLIRGARSAPPRFPQTDPSGVLKFCSDAVGLSFWGWGGVRTFCGCSHRGSCSSVTVLFFPSPRWLRSSAVPAAHRAPAVSSRCLTVALTGLPGSGAPHTCPLRAWNFLVCRRRHLASLSASGRLSCLPSPPHTMVYSRAYSHSCVRAHPAERSIAPGPPTSRRKAAQSWPAPLGDAHSTLPPVGCLSFVLTCKLPAS